MLESKVGMLNAEHMNFMNEIKQELQWANVGP